MTSPIVHIEFFAADHSASAEWYAKVFGWKTAPMAGGAYTTAAWSDAPGMGAGFNQVQGEMPVGAVVPYIMVDSLADAMQRIQDAGGALLTPPAVTPTVGAWCLFKDLNGAIVGILQPEAMPAQNA